MKLSGKTAINASLNETFAAFADFEFFENSAINSGARVRRVDALSSPGPGMKWESFVELRGITKKLSVELLDYDPPNRLDYQAVSAGFMAEIQVELSRKNARKTGAKISLDISAQTLATRLLLKTARLTKGRWQDRLKARVATIGREIEARIDTA